MQPAILAQPQIPIYIRNTLNAAFLGTRIYTRSSTTDQSADDKVVCGFTSIDHTALLNVEGSGLLCVHGCAKRIFGTLEQHGICVVLISQASSEHSVTFATLEEHQAVATREAIEDEFAKELRNNRISRVDLKRPCSIIAAVGDSMYHTAGVSGRFFSALGDAKINVLAIAQGCSERNISAVVETRESTRALRAIHAAFRLSHTTIRVCIIGIEQELGLSLLKLLQDQRSIFRATFGIDLQVVVLVDMAETVVHLKHDSSGGSDSITEHSYRKSLRVAAAAATAAMDDAAAAAPTTSTQSSSSSFSAGVAIEEHGSEAVVANDSGSTPGNGLATVLSHLFRNECTNHVIFDCTNDEAVGKFHATWLEAGVDIVTANNTGLSGPKEQRDKISRAETAHGKQSAKYLRDVTVGGGLPVVSTARQLLQTGDQIRRVDGILSVSLSFIMFRISPPSDIVRCSRFDEDYSHGAFDGDLLISPSTNIGAAIPFSQAVKEAIALGLMEEDPTKDLNNEYVSRVLMVLARELGIEDAETSEIQNSSDKLLEEVVDYNNLPPDIDRKINARVEEARSKGCVLRQISSIDVADRRIETKIVEVPDHHILGVTPPSCETVRFFTHRHRRYPLIVQGPSAGADSTASALLAEVLQLMRTRATPRSVVLSRTGTSAALSFNSNDEAN